MTLSRREMIKLKLMAASSLLLTQEHASAQPKIQTQSEKWAWFPGGALTFAETKTSTGEVISWILSEAQPKEGSILHKHTHQDEVFHVVSGSFEIEVGDESVVAGPGTTVHGPREVPHRWTNIGTQPGRLMTAFTPTGLEKLFHSLAVPIKSPAERPQIDMTILGPKISEGASRAGLVALGATRYHFGQSSI